MASMPIADVMVPSPLAKVRTAHNPTPANPIQHRKQGQHNSRRQNTQRAKSKIASSGQIYWWYLPLDKSQCTARRKEQRAHDPGQCRCKALLKKVENGAIQAMAVKSVNHKKKHETMQKSNGYKQPTKWFQKAGTKVVTSATKRATKRATQTRTPCNYWRTRVGVTRPWRVPAVQSNVTR